MTNTVMQMLLALGIIMLTARIIGGVFRWFHQPPVMGEVVAGILLGPSLLGWIAPDFSALVLPPTVMPTIGTIGQMGVTLFIFVVGLELNLQQLRRHSRASIAISQASIAVPFVLGGLLALPLYPVLSPSGIPFYLFALFMGVSMSVTAFPVLARILTDRGIHKTHIGTIALACAAVDDVAAWCLLALVVSIAQAEPERTLITIAMAVCFVGAMFFLVGPLALRLAKYYEQGGISAQGMTAVICIGLVSSALATEWIGIHALFGAFLFGSIIPHDSKMAQDLRTRIEDLVVVLLLPAFFAFAGMRTEIGLLSSSTEWMLCAVIILVASVGKFGGSFLAARLSGLDWRQSASLGILMNTRGLMELIVLNVGLDLGVISPVLFAMMVVMALVTTLATTPVLQLLSPTKVFTSDQTAAEQLTVAADALPVSKSC